MTALTRSDELYIAECLLSRARHLSRKLTQAERRERPLHPELERKMREDVTECTRLALLLQAQQPQNSGHSSASTACTPAQEECRIYELDGAYKCYTHGKMWGAVLNPSTPCEGWNQ